jgi:hypothetical protein
VASASLGALELGFGGQMRGLDMSAEQLKDKGEVLAPARRGEFSLARGAVSKRALEGAQGAEQLMDLGVFGVLL